MAVDDGVLADKVGQFGDVLLNGGSADTLVASLSGLRIESPSAVAAGAIDLFQPVKVDVPASKFKSNNNNNNNNNNNSRVGERGPIDFSSLFTKKSVYPLQNFLVLISLHFLLILPFLWMACFQYQNDIPGSLLLPYMAVSTNLNGALLSQIQVSGMNLGRSIGNSPAFLSIGQMSPNAKCLSFKIKQDYQMI